MSIAHLDATLMLYLEAWLTVDVGGRKSYQSL